MYRSRFLLLAMLVAVVPQIVKAQTGTIQGTVNDAGGATIPNASVKAVDRDKKIVVRETTTANDGVFNLSPLLPGNYSVSVQAAGFKETQVNDLTLDQNQIMNLGVLVLQVGQITDSVSVESQTPLVETATSQKSFVITSKQVTEIPLKWPGFPNADANPAWRGLE